MSLETLRELRRSGLRPHAVTLVTKACPKPQWRWLADDPTRVYLPQASDVRSHDLRPLVGKDAAEVARGIAAMIDGLYIRQSLRDETLNGAESVALVTGYFDQVAGSPAKDIRVDGGNDARRT